MAISTLDPVDLFAEALHIDPDGELHVARPRKDFEDDRWQLFAHHCETDADVHADSWEMHPAGEEAVVCLRGGMRLYFRDEGTGGDGACVALRTGEAVLVPRGRWHRIELDEPSDLASMTKVRGTRLDPRVTQ
jgi:mannose-6-phosphate isomerase-like protein (cupin superfamily)